MLGKTVGEVFENLGENTDFDDWGTDGPFPILKWDDSVFPFVLSYYDAEGQAGYPPQADNIVDTVGIDHAGVPFIGGIVIGDSYSDVCEVLGETPELWEDYEDEWADDSPVTGYSACVYGDVYDIWLSFDLDMQLTRMYIYSYY